LHLVGPDGTDVLLVNRRGGEGDNFTNTKFDDGAAVGIADGHAPFTGSFRPESPLSAFDGKNARGAWRLVVEDREMGDSGKIVSWSLMIAGEVIAPSPPAVRRKTVKPLATALPQERPQPIGPVLLAPGFFQQDAHGWTGL